MVEKPAKVAALMASAGERLVPRDHFQPQAADEKALRGGLPELAYIRAQLDEHGINVEIRARQLYHDREEVTVHIRRWWAAVGGRRDER